MTLKTQGLQTLEQLRAFLEGTLALGFEVHDRAAAYDFIATTLCRFDYPRLAKPDKGLVMRYLGWITGFSRQQLSRLIKQHRRTGRIRDRRGSPARPFARHYTREDVLRLAELDTLHGTLSGPATRKLCERAYARYGASGRHLQRPSVQSAPLSDLSAPPRGFR